MSSIGIRCVAPAVAAVNLPIAAHQKDHHGQIVVESKDREIDVLHVRQTDTYKFVGDVFDVFETNNLLVEIEAVASGDAAQDDHQRPIRPAGNFLGLVVVELPAEL